MLVLFRQKRALRSFSVRNASLNGKTNPYRQYEKSVPTCSDSTLSLKENISLISQTLYGESLVLSVESSFTKMGAVHICTVKNAKGSFAGFALGTTLDISIKEIQCVLFEES